MVAGSFRGLVGVGSRKFVEEVTGDGDGRNHQTTRRHVLGKPVPPQKTNTNVNENFNANAGTETRRKRQQFPILPYRSIPDNAKTHNNANLGHNPQASSKLGLKPTKEPNTQSPEVRHC